MKRNFREMLEAQWATGKFVCVGLDPDASKIPEHLKIAAKRVNSPVFPETAGAEAAFGLCAGIVEATKDIALCYKPNSAFFEALGARDGMMRLRELIHFIHLHAPHAPVILDAKRGDIGNTNNGYVKSAFEDLKADAITVHPYLGYAALAPFLADPDKGVIVLCRTSNQGAGEFQDLMVENPIAGMDISKAGEDSGPVWAPKLIPLYERVAYNVVTDWNNNGNCALVVGATPTSTFAMAGIRRIVGDNLPFLIPGIGAQGGDLEKTVAASKDSRGRGMIINASRSILYASNGEDFAEAARKETQRMSDEINRLLQPQPAEAV